jgi:hypothetical protein
MSGLTLDDVFKQALIDHFFMTPAPIVQAGPDGHMHAVTPTYTPMQNLVREIVSHNQEEVLQRVLQRLDLDDLADRLATKISERFEQLMSDATSRGYYRHSEMPRWFTEIENTAKQLVAAELADRVLKDMDAAKEKTDG